MLQEIRAALMLTRMILLVLKSGYNSADYILQDMEAVMEIAGFQRLMRKIYFEKDNERGREGTFVWLTEEVGELAKAVRLNDRVGMETEFADVMAWLSSLANLCEIDLEAAVFSKYAQGCPKCLASPCACLEQT